MKKFLKLSAIAGLLVSMSACQKEYEAPKSPVVEMSGKWWVELIFDADEDGELSADDELLFSYHDFGAVGIITSNIASNAPDTVLISDPEESWPFKIKAPVNVSDLTFKPVTGLPNMDIEEATVDVVSGKILKGAAKTLSGAAADSIILSLKFSDAADYGFPEGAVFFYSGHRDSGQPEDQHQ